MVDEEFANLQLVRLFTPLRVRPEAVNDESFVEPLILSSDQGRESRFIGLVEGRVFG